MKLSGSRIAITGASSGIGRETALELARRGARLLLVGRDAGTLEQVRAQTAEVGVPAEVLVQDLSCTDELPGLVDRALADDASLDAWINNAGTLDFAPVELEEPKAVEYLYRTNVVAPIILCGQLVRRFRPDGQVRIVNIGSIFGSIGFAYFASYSGSKFALRGYSEALRRELAGTGVRVSYVAPRATRTRLAQLFGSMATELGMPLDSPEAVAKQVVRAVERGEDERYIGAAERVFVRLNALLPRLVDIALRARNARTRPFAEAAVRQEVEAGDAA